MKKLLVSYLCLFAAVTAYAEQGNLQLSPPPIPYPVFKEGATDVKITGSYVSFKSDDFKLSGAGGQFVGRKAVSDNLALSGNFDMFGAGGNYTMLGNEINTTMIAMNMGGQMEVKALDQNGLSMIAFLGLGLSFNNMSFDKYYTIGGRSVTPTSMSTVMMQMPIGFQFGIPLGDKVKLLPFMVLTNNFGGTTTMHYEGTVSAGTPTSADVDGFVSTQLGTDIVIVPWDLSIGSLWQKSASSGDNKKVDSFSFTMAYHWGGQSAAAKKAVPATPVPEAAVKNAAPAAVTPEPAAQGKMPAPAVQNVSPETEQNAAPKAETQNTVPAPAQESK